VCPSLRPCPVAPAVPVAPSVPVALGLRGADILGRVADEGSLRAAHADADSVLRLARDLIALPSRAGLDDYGPVIDTVTAWLRSRGLPAVVLPGGTGVTCPITGAHPGPRWVLDACLDTAPFGDEDAWTRPPTSAAVHDGWLHGRGSIVSIPAVQAAHHAAVLALTAGADR
jgi:succinyl-diaminopimelate desuccinylase